MGASQSVVDRNIDSCGGKRKEETALDGSNVKQGARPCYDAAEQQRKDSHNSHLTTVATPTPSLKRKVGCIDAAKQQRNDSHHFHPTTVAAPSEKKLPGTRLKRKVDCIDSAKQQSKGSHHLHPTMVAAPTLGKNSREMRLKRRVCCIDAATMKKSLEMGYELGPELGRGTFGVVRLCKNKVSGEIVACKTLHKRDQDNVRKEIEIMQHLSGHPNIVTLHGVYEDANCFHLLMELCQGGSLGDQMSKKGCYSEYQAAKVIKNLMSVIKYCHEMGVVHRDIKPQNILLTNTGQLKLVDFGLSARTKKGQALAGFSGSPAYMAPEIWTGTYSEKVDVWAAGILLHELFTGKLPFNGDSMESLYKAIKEVQLDSRSEKWQSISKPAKDLLSRMLSRNAEKRFSPEEVLSHPWIKFHTESNEKRQEMQKMCAAFEKMLLSTNSRYSNEKRQEMQKMCAAFEKMLLSTNSRYRQWRQNRY